MTNLFFIRHAHTALNKGRYFQGGQTNSHLDDIGQAQLAASADKMNSALPDNYLLVSSPLIRTKETLKGLRLKTDNIVYDERIREIDFGVWEGRQLDPVQAEYPEEVARYFNSDPDVKVENGESIQEVADRMVAAIKYYAKSDYENVVFVSHGNSISIGVSALLLGNTAFQRIAAIPKNVSLSELSYEIKPRITYYNRIFY